MRHQQLKSKDINVLMKLYRSIFGKCRYTSGQLTGPSAAFMADLIKHYRTSNPVELEVLRKIKKRCHC